MPRRALVVLGTFLLAVLLYVDRVCISTAKGPITRELGLTDTQFGWVMSAFAIGRAVSDALVEIVRALAIRPRFVIAKGGITSSDVATRGLGVRRALVRGQILPGVPVWRLGAEARWPELDYVVFPGNVGDAGALAAAAEKFARNP